MRKKRRATEFEREAALILRSLPVVRHEIPHFCTEPAWCRYCAEMREATRRESEENR